MTELIGIKEAADILGVSQVTVWRWVKEGKLLPTSRIGKQAIFKRTSIEEHATRRQAVAVA